MQFKINIVVNQTTLISDINRCPHYNGKLTIIYLSKNQLANLDSGTPQYFYTQC